MTLVSVIIPIYNVEDYLPKCLDSITKQTYTNLEIICVNDCTPDNSAIIIENYAQNDKRIKVINRSQNGGLSAARNSGLEVATGEYIYFIDSDDWIDLDYIDCMVKAIEKADTDIVLNTNIQSVDKNIITPFKWCRYSKKLSDGEYLNTEDAINYSQVMIWAHLYKKSFLDKYYLRFPEGIIHEDEYFQHISKIRCDSVFCFYGSAYYYVKREQSIMTSSQNRIRSITKIIDLLIDFYLNNGLLKKYKIQLHIISILAQCSNLEEYECAKKIANRITNTNLKFSLPDLVLFQMELIYNSLSFEDYRKKIGKNILLTYMRRKTLTQKNKVSVIIPIYNVEHYLAKCLDSVINQTYKNLEIICVNDCSPDNCSQILEQYAQKDNRIRIINRNKNGGLSAARNTGMDVATGEYIYFIDSDDWIDLDYIEKMVYAIEKSNCDVVINRSIITEKSNNSVRYIHPKSENFTDNTIVEQKDAIQKLIWNAWAKICKKSFIDNYKLRFPESFVNEDLYFHYISLAQTNKIYLISNSNYHYLSRNDGISNSENDKDMKILDIFDLIYDYYEEHDLLKHRIKIFSVMPFFFVNPVKYIKYKKYFQKIRDYMNTNKEIFNEIDIFFANNILSTKDFDEYKQKYQLNATISYLKRRRGEHGAEIVK